MQGRTMCTRIAPRGEPEREIDKVINEATAELRRERAGSTLANRILQLLQGDTFSVEFVFGLNKESVLVHIPISAFASQAEEFRACMDEIRK